MNFKIEYIYRRMLSKYNYVYPEIDSIQLDIIELEVKKIRAACRKREIKQWMMKLKIYT